MKKLMLFGITVLWLSILAMPAGAQVNVQVGIQLPPLIVFSSPPEMIVLPATYVYVVPDIAEDIFFCDGWWWRPWHGHWYRSQHYDRGWAYYNHVPTFYREVPRDWRHEYREHHWRGQPWQYERIPHQQVEKNWNNWKRDNYWEKHQTWGVQGYKPQHASHGHEHQVQNPEHHGQQPQAQQPAPRVQQPQAHQQPSQQPNKGQVNQGQGNQGHGQGNQGHGQGNQGQGQGNKDEKQHGGKKGK